MKKQLIGLGVATLMFGGVGVAGAAVFDGSSSINAGVSAKQILNYGYSLGDALYWIDPDGVGGNDAFQVYADMTTRGGGWTLGLNSLADDVAATTDMVSNTGVVGIDTGHTRDMIILAIDNEAEIRHRIVDLDDGSILLDAYYTGSYHDTLPLADQWTILDGELTNFEYHLGRDWSTPDNDQDLYPGNCSNLYGDVPWYYGSCWKSIPTVGEGTSYIDNVPAYGGSGEQRQLQWSIYVRESVSPATPTPTPEPATMLLFGTGIVGLVGSRLKNSDCIALNSYNNLNPKKYPG